jgi:hypothetical protein
MNIYAFLALGFMMSSMMESRKTPPMHTVRVGVRLRVTDRVRVRVKRVREEMTLSQPLF